MTIIQIKNYVNTDLKEEYSDVFKETAIHNYRENEKGKNARKDGGFFRPDYIYLSFGKGALLGENEIITMLKYGYKPCALVDFDGLFWYSAKDRFGAGL